MYLFLILVSQTEISQLFVFKTLHEPRGVLTFKNSGLKDVIAKIDVNHLILETDAPYLTPTPFRGKRNESKYIINIAEKLAKVKGISLDEIADITTKNATNLFKI